MKLRAYLVDDEPLALERLRRLLENTGRVEVTGFTTKPEEAVAALTEDPPDVCFLDIQMPRLTGFEVLAKLANQPIVVFTTAYDKYALKAFGVSAADYLLKPVEPETLTRALNQVERLRGQDCRHNRIYRFCSATSQTRFARASPSFPGGLRRASGTGFGSLTWIE